MLSPNLNAFPLIINLLNIHYHNTPKTKIYAIINKEVKICTLAENVK